MWIHLFFSFSALAFSLQAGGSDKKTQHSSIMMKSADAIEQRPRFGTELTPFFLDKLHRCAFIYRPLVLEGEQLVTWKQKNRNVNVTGRESGSKAANVAAVSAERRVPGERETPRRDETGRHCSKAQIETDHRLCRLLPQSVACKFTHWIFTIKQQIASLLVVLQLPGPYSLDWMNSSAVCCWKNVDD